KTSYADRLRGPAAPRGLEVHGLDEVRVECADEGLDVGLHVLPGEGVERLDEHVRPAVQHLVEALDLVLRVHGAVAPLAVRAAQLELPAVAVGLAPVDRVDQVALAGRAALEAGG